MGKITHGYSNHPLYSIIHCMEVRCYSVSCDSYNRYGGAGITVCNEWLLDKGSFIKWALSNGWEDGLEIDRINETKGYYPDNCQFVTRSENQLKKRTPVNNTSGYKGVNKNNKKYHFAVQKFRSKTIYTTSKDCAIARDLYILTNNINAPLAFGG